MTELYEELAGRPADPADDGRFYGVAIGIVTNNKDPDGLGRVKLKLPWLSDDVESAWARVASPMAGNNHGVYLLPEVDSEVLVAFEHGHLQVPYVVGALWNGKRKPPVSNADGKNDVRAIVSRSGHVVRLTDTNGQEKIEIVDKSGKNSIVVDTKAGTVTITADNDVSISSAKGRLSLKGAKGVEIVSDAQLTLQARSKAELTASGQTVIKGAQVSIN